MSEYIEVCAHSPQKDKISLIRKYLNEGGVIAYPTETGYALGCKIGLKAPLNRIKRIRQLTNNHNFTLIFNSLKDISSYAYIDNVIYRILKKYMPGEYTFILDATKKISSVMSLKSKKTVGIRISTHPIPSLINEIMGEPIISTSLILPGDTNVLSDAEDVGIHLSKCLSCIIDCGYSGFGPTTVIDLSSGKYELLRLGIAPSLI